jgi:hypothetical protein
MYDPQTWAYAGSSTGTLAAAGSLTLDVVQGTAVPQCDQSRTGSDGFVYDAYCSGELRSGGTTDGRLSDAYENHAYLRVNGSDPSGRLAAKLEMDGRQVVYGPVEMSGIVATRKLFVPPAGGFARYLDTVTNPSAVPVTVNVQIEGTLGGVVHLVVDPATTGNTYAVTLADATTVPLLGSNPAIRPALAHVFGGPGGLVSVSAVHIQQFFGPTFYRWTVTIPAGESVTLMHFAVQREPSDTAGATAQAQALVNLSDPNALAGMTAEEKARVVNFKLSVGIQDVAGLRFAGTTDAAFVSVDVLDLLDVSSNASIDATTTDALRDCLFANVAVFHDTSDHQGLAEAQRIRAASSRESSSFVILGLFGQKSALALLRVSLYTACIRNTLGIGSLSDLFTISTRPPSGARIAHAARDLRGWPLGVFGP